MKKLIMMMLISILICSFSLTCVQAKTTMMDSALLIQDDFAKIEAEEVTCEKMFKNASGEFNEFGQALQDLFNLIKYAVPAIVIGLTTLDYIKAISSHDAEDLKKANTKFIKRLVIGLIIFLLPFLLDLTFEAFGVYDIETCGIGK